MPASRWPLAKSIVAEMRNSTIGSLILAKESEAKLYFSSPYDRHTFCRRVPTEGGEYDKDSA